jgi:cytoskeletal protein CcmA (bactofilin family)
MIGPRRLILGVGRWLCAQGRLLKASPFAFYRMLGRKRDWVVAKVEYAHAESGKWRACWTCTKLPYTGLRAMGLNPQMAIGLLALGGTAGGGVVVNETLLAERSFSGGDSGVYSAPADVPTSYSEGDNTLLIQLSAVPVGSIEISAIDLATSYANSTLPSGETNAIEIGGSAALSNYLEVGHLIIDRWRCETFRMEYTEAHTLNIVGNVADGLSVSPVPGVIRKRAVGGGLRAENMSVSNSTYDQIRITAPTSAVNGQVDVLRISNLATRGGGCLISRVKAGTITIEYLTVGKGNGLALKDLVVATSTTYSVANISDNVEELISPLPAP